MRRFLLSDLTTRAKQRADMENDDHVATSEWQFILGSCYAELYSIVVASGMRYLEAEQEINTVASGYATGTITCVTKAELVDGEQFTLNDGYGAITFEFDLASPVVTAGTTQVDVSADTTAEHVEARIITAVNAATHADGTAFRITAANGGSGIVALTHDAKGRIGNQLSSETVADADFVVTNMTGGGGRYVLPTNYMASIGVDYLVSSSTGERRELYELMIQERNYASSVAGAAEAYAYALEGLFLRLYPQPPSGQVYYHTYVPQAPDLASAGTSTYVDVVTPDGENFLLWAAALIALQKEESDIRGALAERERARARVEEWATLRALNSPRRRIVDEGRFGGYRDAGDWWPRQ